MTAPPAPPIARLLIANRGEIAVRVARACRGLGIAPIAVASDADRGAFHTRVADQTIPIGPAPAADSYLRVDRIIEAARSARCDAVHPGYGFLSQSPAFAAAVAAAGLRFVGPPPEAMRLMGDKIAARRAMQAAGVPVIPGWEGRGDEPPEVLRREAGRLGYPVLVKAAGGGGGRGLRIVSRAADLDEAAAAARREALKAFGDGRLFLEKVIEDAHHVEIQVLADTAGTVVHLGERECSLQRRFQKVMEEAPSPVVDATLRDAMGRCAVLAARACGYVNAGTIEFLVGADRRFYFLEMNTRIQVEHPVTEMVTGVDIVQAQIRIAAGELLGLAQDRIVRSGWAVECRVNAEDPRRSFAPSSGPILWAEFPQAADVRVDAGIETGDTVTPHYDSLLAKVIVRGPDRDSALRRMHAVLGGISVLGVRTNLPWLRALLEDPVVRAGKATTGFLENGFPGWTGTPAPLSDDALVALAVAEALDAAAPAHPASGADEDEGDRFSPWDRADRFRVGAA